LSAQGWRREKKYSFNGEAREVYEGDFFCSPSIERNLEDEKTSDSVGSSRG